VTREERIHRGQEAARMLENEIMTTAFGELEKDAVEAIVSAAPDDHVARHHNAIRIAVIRDLRQQLRSVVTTGQQAAAERPKGL
jgi:hypothetical protein